MRVSLETSLMNTFTTQPCGLTHTLFQRVCLRKILRGAFNQLPREQIENSMSSLGFSLANQLENRQFTWQSLIPIDTVEVLLEWACLPGQAPEQEWLLPAPPLLYQMVEVAWDSFRARGLLEGEDARLITRVAKVGYVACSKKIYLIWLRSAWFFKFHFLTK